MPPRGRPPGRKSGLPTRQQQRKLKQQKTAKKPGRIPRKNSTPASTAQEIHVADSAEEMETETRNSSPDLSHMNHTAPATLNGARHTSQRPSVGVDDETVSDSQSVVMMDDERLVQPPSAAAAAAAAAEETDAASAPAPTASVSPPPPSTNGQPRARNGESPAAPVRGAGNRPGPSNGRANGVAGRSASTRAAGNALSYAAPNIDLDVLSYRQLSEDIDAYNVDLDFCTSQLAQPELTPQEMRTLQLRRLDLGHQIRYSQHRREMLEAQRLVKGGRPLTEEPRRQSGLAAPGKTQRLTKRAMSVAALLDEPSTTKRVRARSVSEAEASGPETISAAGSDSGAGPASMDLATMTPMSHGADEDTETPGQEGGTHSLQRLGYWKCRLCTSEKYLMAGAGRQPSAPSKWPLKDMGKLMSHYFDMHTEHEPDERCAELGDALDHNRGPFEYWLRKSRAQRITDLSVIDQVVQELQAGHVPKTLRDLCRAAAAFPGS